MQHERSLVSGRMRRIALAAGLLAALLPAPAVAQEATIRRTAHGVPHIEAKDYAGLGYGYGYALAEDNLCTIAEQYVTVRGERSRFFGPDATYSWRANGSTNRNLESDFVFTRIIDARVVEGLLAKPPPNGPRPEIRAGVRGYVAGYNRYLRETGVANLPDPTCRGAAWVRPIEEMDVYRRFYQLALLASSGVALDGIGGAQPPTPGAPAPPLPVAADFDALAGQLPLGGIGSNALGLGSDKTSTGKGMLLGNPHFPWDGAERFYQAHLTIPGKIDVSGGSLFGVPLVLIGHTRGLAWSHTVSTAFRFTPFELTLVPGSPTTYLVDGRPQQMTAQQVTVQARTPSGGLEPRTRTLYSTRYGPVFTSLLGLPLFPWTPAKAWALGDANAANFRYLNHFFETNLAQSTREYDAVLRRNQGIPWVNSIGADARGEAYYADISVVPHVTDEQAQTCNTALGAATFQALRLPILDGSRSACDWGRDADAIQPGTFGPSHMPSMFRRDFTSNMNDSYWLTNPKQPLTGFDRIIGDEDTARSLRTRLGLIMVQGGLFSLRKLQDTVFNDRQYAGELWRDEAVAMCRQMALGEPCDVLAKWDLHDNLDSRGALLFRRFAERVLALPDGGFSTPYSSADPVNTPRGLQTSSPAVRKALTDAIAELQGLGIPLNARLGDVQAEQRGGERIPIHGGPGEAGLFNAINVQAADLTSAKGYETVPHGSSFVQAVSFVDGPCPVVPRTILTYSQSTNPRSPFFADQTRMFSRKAWNPVPFCRADVLAQTVSTTRLGAGRACVASTPLGRVTAKRRGRRVRVRWGGGGRATVDVLRGKRRVKRVKGRRGRATWTPRRPGVYVLRVRKAGETRRLGVRVRAASGAATAGRPASGQARSAATARGLRPQVLRPFERRARCGRIRLLTLSSPASRGRLAIRYRLASRARARLTVRRGKRVVRVVRRRAARSGRVRVRAPRRGTYRVTLRVGRTRASVFAVRL
jgi:acyl-homoserine-lactone acylase